MNLDVESQGGSCSHSKIHMWVPQGVPPEEKKKKIKLCLLYLFQNHCLNLTSKNSENPIIKKSNNLIKSRQTLKDTAPENIYKWQRTP